MKSLRDLTYVQRLEKLGLTSLEARRERADLIEYYKIENGLSVVDWHNPNKLSNSLALDGPASSIRGQKHRLTKQLTKVSHREHFILNRVVNNWNKLPPAVIEVKSKNEFKKKLDEFNTAGKLKQLHDPN